MANSAILVRCAFTTGVVKTSKASARSRMIVVKASEKSSGFVTASGSTVRPRRGATSSCIALSVLAAGRVSGLKKKATRLMLGLFSLRSSRFLAKMVSFWLAMPVMLPPGRASDATKPEPTGSAILTMIIGIVVVLARAATIACVCAVRMTSTLGAASSAANSGRRPGGNVTGFTGQLEELNIKQLELLRELVPWLMSVTILYNPRSPGYTSERLDRISEAGAAAGLKVRQAAVAHPKDLELVV